MKLATLSTLALITFAVSAKAAFINIGTGEARGHQIVTSSNVRVGTTALNPANRVVFGYMTTANTSSSFVEFATTTINNPTLSSTLGGFISVPTGNNPSTTALAAMKNPANQVAMWVYGNGGEQGLFTSTAWTAPASVTTEIDSSWDLIIGVVQGSAALNVSAVPIPGFQTGVFTPNTTITVGSTSNTSGSQYKLGAVPEPTTTVFLAMLGGLAVMRRKR